MRALSWSTERHMVLAIVTIGVATLMLAFGTPIYLVISALAGLLLLNGGMSTAGVGQHVLDHLNSPILAAVPFFLLAAVVMRGGGIATALFEAARTWLGRLPGGLALAGIAATAVFAAINGSSVATALAMGTLLVPSLIERGYEPKFAMGLTAAAATLGILIPPSLPMILIGLIAEESIPRLFLAGVVPGLLQAALFGVYVLLMARRKGASSEPWPPTREFLAKNARAMPAMTIPVIILGGLWGGFVSLTESAVLGAVVALIVVLFVYRSAKVGRVFAMFTESIDRMSVIVVIILAATLLSAWIIKSGVPQAFAREIIAMGINPRQFLLLLNLILLVMGMFLEGVAIILIVLPVVGPVIRGLGIDPVHFAVVMVINIELALLSPPIGLNLFVMANVTERPVGDVLRGSLPFFVLMLGLLLLVTFVPALSTWLPGLVMG